MTSLLFITEYTGKKHIVNSDSVVDRLPVGYRDDEYIILSTGQRFRAVSVDEWNIDTVSKSILLDHH